MTNRITNKNGVKLLAAIAVFAIAFVGLALVPAFETDAGTEDAVPASTEETKILEKGADKKYHINTAEDLWMFAKMVNELKYSFGGETVILDKDINLNGKEWTPVSQMGYEGWTQFTGTFDGNNLVISNFVVSDKTNEGKYRYWGYGFFGALDFTATIKNLTISNATVSGHHYVGAVAGYFTGEMRNCHVTDSDISATVGMDREGDKAGAIAGFLNPAWNDKNRKGVTSVEDCSASKCTVKAEYMAGQLFGAMHDNFTTVIKDGEEKRVTTENCKATDVSVEIVDNPQSKDDDAGKYLNNSLIGFLTRDGKTEVPSIYTVAEGGKLTLLNSEDITVKDVSYVLGSKITTITIPTNITFNSTITYDGNSISFKKLVSGEEGVIITPGSLTISGTIDASQTVEITASGEIKIDDVTVTVPEGSSTTTESGLTIVSDGLDDTSVTVVGDFQIEGGACLIVEGDLNISNGASLVLENEAELTVVGNAKVDGEINVGTGSTVKVEGTLDPGSEGEFTGNTAGITVATYEVGSKVTLGGITYTVYKGTSGSDEIYYGISCGNIPYTGKEVTKYDVKVYSRSLTGGYKLTNQTYDLDPNGKYIDADVYENALLVQLTFSNGTVNVTMNDVLNLTVQQATPKVDVKLGEEVEDEYSFNMFFNEYTNEDVAYYYNGSWYALDDDSSPVIAEMKLTTDEKIYTDISELTAGSYILAIVFDESKDGNYKATEVQVQIKVTDEPVDSEISFDAVSSDADLFGKTVDQLQYNFKFGKATATGVASAYEVELSGSLIKVEGYEGFSTIESEQTGYYLAFTINNKMVNEKSVLEIRGGKTITVEGVAINDSYVLFLGNVNEKENLTSFEIAIDFDGDGTQYNNTKYSFDLEEIEFMKLLIKFVDSENQDVFVYPVEDEGEEEIILPNGAGTDRKFIGWEDENGNLHAALSKMKLVKSLDANSDKIILMVAKYGEAGSAPGVAAEKYDVLVNATSEGVSVAVYALDGGDVVESDITVTFSVLIEIEGLEGFYLPDTITKTVHVGAGSSPFAYAMIDFSELGKDYNSVYGFKATYQSVTTGFMQCSYEPSA